MEAEAAAAKKEAEAIKRREDAKAAASAARERQQSGLEVHTKALSELEAAEKHSVASKAQQQQKTDELKALTEEAQAKAALEVGEAGIRERERSQPEQP